MSKSHEKAEKLKEANQQQDFIMAVKDLEMWMAEVIEMYIEKYQGNQYNCTSDFYRLVR